MLLKATIIVGITLLIGSLPISAQDASGYSNSDKQIKSSIASTKGDHYTPTTDTINTPKISQEIPLYGFTKDGLFFIAKSLIVEFKGSKPKFRADLTDWEDCPMKEQNGYYIYKYDIKSQPLTDKVIYCFSIGGNRYIPHVLVNKRPIRYNHDDVSDNNQGGYNFKTLPLEKCPF